MNLLILKKERARIEFEKAQKEAARNKIVAELKKQIERDTTQSHKIAKIIQIKKSA